jgi:hypothetical protein
MAYEQWTEDEARSALEAWKRSGSGIVQFARSRGMSPQRLYRWRRKLDFDAAESLAPALLPIRVAEERSVPAREPVTVLLRSGHVIKVARDFDESVFRRVVALLERG